VIRKSLRSIRKLIPWYINGSLSPNEVKEVSFVIRQDDQVRNEYEAWKQIHAAVTSQEQRVPSAVVRQQIMSSLLRPNVNRGMLGESSRYLLAGALLTLTILILLWLAVRPGVVLQWSIERDGMTSYRVYRASPGSNQFELIKEVTAQTEQYQYRFIDTLLIPGKNYIYRVEGIRSNGVATLSQVVNSSALDILPGQLALILTSIIIGYGVVIFIHRPWIQERNAIGYYS
jgi:hypothetical protein